MTSLRNNERAYTENDWNDDHEDQQWQRALQAYDVRKQQIRAIQLSIRSKTVMFCHAFPNAFIARKAASSFR